MPTLRRSGIKVRHRQVLSMPSVLSRVRAYQRGFEQSYQIQESISEEVA